MKRIVLIDDYNYKKEHKIKTDGASTKTDNMYNYLKSKYSSDDVQVIRVLLPSWRKHPITNFLKIMSSIKRNDIVFILPNHVRLPLYAKLFKNHKKRHLKIFYMVVGGWLPEFLEKNIKVLNFCKEINGVFPETLQMVETLKRLGVDNTFHSPVFSAQTDPIPTDLYRLNINEPIKICTFSRIDVEKGILLAIDAVADANKQLGKNVYFLEMYGRIMDESKVSFFNNYFDKNKDSCSYVGPLKSDEIIKVLNNHFLLLFPTFFWGEGFPGTLLEAYKAALPVVASDWRYNSELVIDGETGFLFEAKNTKALSNILVKCYNNYSKVLAMRKRCLDVGSMYTIDYCLESVNRLLERVIKLNEDC